MAGRLKRLRIVFSLRKDLIFPLTVTPLSVAGAIASIYRASPNYWILAVSLALAAVSILWLTVPLFRAWRLSYSDVWLNMQQARNWIRPRLFGNPSYLQRCGVNQITVIGVACTDIGDLFREVAEAVGSGMSFRVCLVNPNHSDVGENGVIKQWEHDGSVSTVVQKPLTRKLEQLATYYEGQMKHRVAGELRRLKGRLEAKNLTDHADCIRVCQELWLLAAKEGVENRMRGGGGISTYYCDDLPFAKQWIFEDRALVFSTYVGHPGVGVDNPVFCYSSFENAEGPGEIARRATYYAERLIEKCGAPQNVVS